MAGWSQTLARQSYHILHVECILMTKLSIGPSVGRYSVFRVALPHFLSALDLALHNKLFAHFNLTEIKANLKSWGNILMLLCSY